MIPSRARSSARDDGSATVEYLLVSVLVLAVALAVIQLAVAMHVRNILVSSAHDGAHYAALADRSLADGEAHSLALVESSLGGVATGMESSHTTIDGAPAVTIRIDARVPLIGLWGVGTQSVEAHALAEIPND